MQHAWAINPTRHSSQAQFKQSSRGQQHEGPQLTPNRSALHPIGTTLPPALTKMAWGQPFDGIAGFNTQAAPFLFEVAEGENETPQDGDPRRRPIYSDALLESETEASNELTTRMAPSVPCMGQGLQEYHLGYVVGRVHIEKHPLLQTAIGYRVNNVVLHKRKSSSLCQLTLNMVFPASKRFS